MPRNLTYILIKVCICHVNEHGFSQLSTLLRATERSRRANRDTVGEKSYHRWSWQQPRQQPNEKAVYDQNEILVVMIEAAAFVMMISIIGRQCTEKEKLNGVILLNMQATLILIGEAELNSDLAITQTL